MNIKFTLQAFILGLLICASSFAQKAGETKFTSIYTNLNKDCKVLRATGGGDDALLCKGAGNYQIRVYYSAASTHINAELKGTDGSTPIATLSVSFNEKKTTLEWRMANGKPFAVIMRVPEYAEVTNEGEYYGKVMGQKLVVVGLAGFDISGEIDAKTKDANVKAREIADKGYTAKS